MNIYQDEPTIWEKIAEKADITPITTFTRHISRLPISENDIRGDVLVIGPGFLFPEKIFLTTPESDLRKLRPSIKTLSVCEEELVGGLGSHFEMPSTVLSPSAKVRLQRQRINFMPSGFLYFAQVIPNERYDLITLFREVDLQGQLENEMLDQIARIIRKNAVFMGSGSFENIERAANIFSGNRSLVVESLTYLPNPSDGYPFDTHVGFIARKTK